MAPRQPWTFREAVAFVAFAIVAIGYSWWRHYWFVRHGEGVWRLGLFSHTWFYYAEPFIILAAYGAFLGGRALWRHQRRR